MSEYSDTELMAMLSSAFSPTPVMPDAATLTRLHATLAELSNAPSLTVVNRAGRPKRFTELRGRMARRTSVVAAVTLLFTGGIATAAVATDTLPGPTRNLAYDIGLPVTSPGLYQAQSNLEQLKSSIDHRNHSGEVRWGRSLQHDLKNLNDGDLAQIRVPALSLLSEAGLEDPLTPSVTTSTTVPTNNDNSDSNGSSASPTSTVPSASENDSSRTGAAGSGQLVPTITVPSPTDLVPSTSTSGDGNNESLPTTTSVLNPDEVTVVTLPPLSDQLSNGN